MILSVNQVHKSFGKEKVLKGISFKIEKPQIVALVGPNGSGKSTLLNIITNLAESDQGNITILGKSNKDPKIFKEISFMQDNSVLYDYLTGYDHLQFIGDIQGISKNQIIRTAKRVGMDTYLNKKVGKYSLGMKQHLLLTMALVNEPKLLILDEPLNGLDPTSAIRVRELLLDENKKGSTILLSSHNLAEIDRVTSQILFLKNGSLMEENLSLTEQVYYEFHVNNIKRAQKAMIEAKIAMDIVDNKLCLNKKDSTFQQVLQVFEENDVEVLDVEKKVYGSEERYKQIFVKNGELQ